jgi:hypothetical protein
MLFPGISSLLPKNKCRPKKGGTPQIGSEKNQ